MRVSVTLCTLLRSGQEFVEDFVIPLRDFTKPDTHPWRLVWLTILPRSNPHHFAFDSQGVWDVWQLQFDQELLPGYKGVFCFYEKSTGAYIGCIGPEESLAVFKY